jgi:hypothetical protein
MRKIKIWGMTLLLKLSVNNQIGESSKEDIKGSDF